MKNIVIIGGSDGFGFWLANYILNNFKSEINLKIIGRNKEKLIYASEKLGCDFSQDHIKDISNADITIFSVPISSTLQTIKKYCPYLKNGSIVLDVTSIKKGPSEYLKKYSPNGVLVVPTHPMFGPFISTISGQIFVLTPEDDVKNDNRYIFLKHFLKNNGALVIEEDPTEHDKMMAVVQGLTHFNMFVLANTMKSLDFSIEKSLNFVSPIYKIMISSVGRYIYQNPKLYSDIQMNNTEILEVHEKFMESSNLFSSFVKEKKEDLFLETIEDSKKYFGENSLVGQKYTDKIIFMIGKQSEIIENNIGKKLIFENIYSREEFTDIVEKYDSPNIYLKSGKIIQIDEYNIIEK